jgi:hypothetical protein
MGYLRVFTFLEEWKKEEVHKTVSAINQSEAINSSHAEEAVEANETALQRERNC